VSLSTCFVRCVFVLVITSRGLLAGEVLSIRQSPVAGSIDLRDRPVPKFRNSFIVSFSPIVADVWLFDSSGSRVSDVRLAIPDASLLSDQFGLFLDSLPGLG
jgi:hypothetical protein